MTDPQVTLRIKADGSDASAKLKQAALGLDALGESGRNAEAGLGATLRGVQSISAQLDAVKSNVYSYIAAQAGLQNVTKALSAASDYGRLVAGLNLVEGSAKAGAAALQEVQAIAQRQGVGLDAVGESYQRIARAVRLYGGDSADAAKMTETVSAALRLNNASAAEASAVMRQFSQAMGKGKVNGDEFMSLMENAPTLMDSVAKSLGKTKAELYAMSEAGTLTSDVFGGAVLGSFASMTAQASKLPMTFDQSSVAMKNAFTIAAGESRQVGVALNVVNGVMGLLAENAQAVLGVAVVAGAGAASYGVLRLAVAGQAAVASMVANRAATLASLQAEVVRTEVLVAQTAAQAANTGVTTAHTAALAAQAAAQNALAVAASRGAVVMAALGGPIGVVTGLLALGAAAWSFYADSAADGAAKASKESKPSFDELIQGIDVQIEMLKKRNALAAKGIKLEGGTGSALEDEAARISAEIDRLRVNIKSAPDIGTQNWLIGLLAESERRLGVVTEKMRTLKSEAAQDADNRNKKTKAEWMKEYATDAEKLKTEMEKVGKSFSDGVVPADLAARIKAKFGKGMAEVATQAAEFEAQRQKLFGDELVAITKDRVARQVLAEEDGIRQIAKIKVDEVAAKMAAEQRAAKVNAADPGKAQKHTQAAALAAIEMSNINAQAAREIAAVTQKRADELRGIELQTQAVQKHGIAIDSINTLLLKERVSRTEVALATAEQNRQLAEQRGVGEAAAQKEVERLRTELDALRRNAAQGHLKDVTQAGLDQATRLFGSQSEDQFKSLGNTLRETFATSGDGLARMVDAMGTLTDSGKEYAREMQVIAQLRESGTESNLATAAKNEQALIKKTQKDQVGAYASMASAAKTYFKEGSRGYAVMQGAEKALRTYQLVMSAQTMAKDLVAIGAKVSAWIFGETAMTEASTAASAVRTTEAMVEGQANAVTGVANQAKGDPYTAFPRMAAMAAMMAALGFMVSGGGSSGSVSRDALSAMPENTGTGTVFGDSKAQSQSIRNSLESLTQMAKPELAYTSMMAASLRNIEAGVVSGTSLLLRGGFDSSSSNFAALTSNSLSTLASTVGTLTSTILNPGGIFGSGLTNAINGVAGWALGSSSTSQSVTGEGLLFSQQTLAQAAQRVAVQTYRTILTTVEESGYFGIGGSSDSSYSTLTGAAPVDFVTSLTKTIQAIRDTVISAGNQISSMSQAQINAINSMDTGLGKINLKDKTAKEIEDILSQRLSALADNVARAVNPVVLDFIKAGEGPYEALMRVSSGMEQARYYTERLGVSLAALSTVQNKSGDVSAELLRQSILMKESVTSMVEVHIGGGGGFFGIPSFSFNVPVTTLNNLGELIQNFTGSVSELADFYSGLLRVQNALVSLGHSAGSVTADLLNGAGGIDALQSGISAFEDNFLTEAEKAVSVQSRVAAEFAKFGLTMPSTAAAFKAMVQSVDDSTAAGQKQLGQLLSLSSTFKEFVDAQDAATQAQRDLVAALLDSGKSIRQWVDKLDEGSLGLSTPAQKLVDSRASYIQTLSLAKGNDKDALAAVTTDAQAYLQAARDGVSTQAQYAAVLAQVKSELVSLPAVKGYDTQVLDALTLLNATATATNSVTGSVATNTQSQVAATVQMNDNSLVAISFNTSKALDFAASQVDLLLKVVAATEKIAANPTTVVNQSSGGGGGLFGSLIGGAIGAVSGALSVFGFAQGDVFGGSGVFTQPTSFNFGTQLGALGEDGAEAVMPLKRLGDGSLGVRADLGGLSFAPPMVNMAPVVQALSDGFDRLSQRLDQLDENNMIGHATAASNTGKTARILGNASTGEALRFEQVAA